MSMNITKLEVSGRGIVLDREIESMDHNFRMTIRDTKLYEVVQQDTNETIRRIGWLIHKNITVTTDFTVHTDNGMRGESFIDELNEVMLIDRDNSLSEIEAEEIIELDKSEGEQLLNRFQINNFNLRNDLHMEEALDNSIVILSLNPERVFVQTKGKSVRIGQNGICVLDKKEDSLVLISDKHGITVVKNGGRIIEINDHDNLTINGKQFNPELIIEKVKNSISKVFSDFDYW